MKPQKIFFPDNLRHLRGRKQFSQEFLAQQLGFSRVKLNALESGKTVNPAVEDLVKFSEYFKISIDSLLKVNLSKLTELQLRDLEAGNDVFMMGTKLRVLAISVDKDNNENIEYVPVSAKMGYQSGFADPEFIASLPKYNMPNLPKHGTFRIFPAEGDSMLPVPDKSEITGQYVENWKDLKPDTPCVVILEGNRNFVFKLVTVQKDGSLLLHSLNKLYQPYVVAAGEVLEIWKFHKLHTTKLPEPDTDLQELKNMLEAMTAEIKNLKC